MEEHATPVDGAGMVSVVVPVYNVEAYVAQALQSLREQTYADWECICVDDGSTDGSADIVRSFVEKDPRFRLITQPNQGPGAARNNALAQVRGRYLMFMDADDLVHPALMETCIRRMEADGSDVCVYRWVDFSGERPDALCEPAHERMPVPEGAEYAVLPPQDSRGDLFLHTPAYAWVRMYRMDLVRKEGIEFCTDIRYGEDIPFVLTALASAGRITYLRAPLYYYRNLRQGNQSTSLKGEHACRCFLEASRRTWERLRERNLLDLFGKDEINRTLHFICNRLRDLNTLASTRKACRGFEALYAAKLAELEDLGVVLDEADMLKIHQGYRRFRKAALKAKLRIILQKTGLFNALRTVYRCIKH